MRNSVTKINQVNLFHKKIYTFSFIKYNFIKNKLQINEMVPVRWELPMDQLQDSEKKKYNNWGQFNFS